MTTTTTRTTIILPIYLQKYIIKIICDHLNKQVIFDYTTTLIENNKTIVNLSLVCWSYHKCISNSLWSIQDFNFKPLPERFYPPKPLSNRKLYIGNELGNRYSIYKFENIKTLRLFHREYRYHEDDLSTMYKYLNEEILCKFINLSLIYIDVEHKQGSNSIHSVAFVNQLKLPNPLSTIIEIRKISLRYLTSRLISNVRILNSLLIEDNQRDWDQQIINNLVPEKEEEKTSSSSLLVKCIKFQTSTPSKINFIKTLINQPTNEKLNTFLSGIPSLRIEQLPLSFILPLFQEIPSFFNISEFHFTSCFKVLFKDDKRYNHDYCNCKEHNFVNSLLECYKPLEWESTCQIFNELPNLKLLSITDSSCKLGTSENNIFNSLIYKLLVNNKTIKTLNIKGCKDLKLIIDLIKHNPSIQNYNIQVEKVPYNKDDQIETLTNQLLQIKSLLNKQQNKNNGSGVTNNINTIQIQYSEVSNSNGKNKKQKSPLKLFSFKCSFKENTYLLNYNRQLLINDSI